MLGTSAGCWHTCAYKKGFPDYCHNNTIIQGTRSNPRPGQAPVPPYAIIWFCDAKNVSHILPDYNNQVIHRGTTVCVTEKCKTHSQITTFDGLAQIHIFDNMTCDTKLVFKQVQMGFYIHSNRIYNDFGEANVTCGYSGPESSTTVPLSAFTSAGMMKVRVYAFATLWELMSLRCSNRR